MIYAANNISQKDRLSSRSGGIFPLLSDIILNGGGVVYGAGFDGNWNVVHKRAVSTSEIEEFRGSKYVQSDIRKILPLVMEDLKAGRDVCFSGTPCQVAAVKNIAGQELLDHLYTIDILCHGVASPRIWRGYLDFIEKISGKKVTGVKFRDKERFNWIDHFESIKLGNRWHSFNIWSYLYTHNLLVKDPCCRCKFASKERAGDISLGDLWGVDRHLPEFNKDNKGCSLVICNTGKGQKWFDAIKTHINFTEIDIDDYMQPALENPAPANPNKHSFEDTFNNYGFFKAASKYGNLTIPKQLRWNLWLIKKKLLHQ